MDDITRTVLGSMSGVKVPQAKFLLVIFMTLRSFVGKANYRNLSRHCRLCEQTFARWYAREFDFATFNMLLVEHELDPDNEKIAVIDASFLPKSGKETEGLGMFWNGSAGKAQKGLEVSTIGIVDVQSNTAYGIDTRLTRNSCSNTQDNRTEQYCQQIQAVSDRLKQLNVRYLATDGLYSANEFTSTILDEGLHQVGKLRHDARLYWRYEGEYSSIGRPRKYDGVADTKVQDLKRNRWKYIESLEDGTNLFEGIVWATAVKQWIKVVILRKYEGGKLWQALLFSTDLKLAATTIVVYYKRRFQIEFLFRDAKQHTGLGDCQARKTLAIESAANFSITALNLLKLEDRREAQTEDQTVISIESWKRRKANQQLMNLLFDVLEIDRNEKNVVEAYEELSNFGCIAA